MRKDKELELTDFYFMEFVDGKKFSRLDIENNFAERFIEHHKMKKILMSYNGANGYRWTEKK